MLVYILLVLSLPLLPPLPILPCSSTTNIACISFDFVSNTHAHSDCGKCNCGGNTLCYSSHSHQKQCAGLQNLCASRRIVRDLSEPQPSQGERERGRGRGRGKPCSILWVALQYDKNYLNVW